MRVNEVKDVKIGINDLEKKLALELGQEICALVDQTLENDTNAMEHLKGICKDNCKTLVYIFTSSRYREVDMIGQAVRNLGPYFEPYKNIVFVDTLQSATSGKITLVGYGNPKGPDGDKKDDVTVAKSCDSLKYLELELIQLDWEIGEKIARLNK